MRVTNTSGVVQRVRGIDGVETIQPGMSRLISFTDEGLARVRDRSYLKVEDETPAPQPKPKPAKVS
jgi:hypothetical protein